MPIASGRVFFPVQREAGFDHLSRQISPICEMTQGNSSFVGRAAIGDGRDHLTMAKPHQRPLGILAVRMIEFWRVYASEANMSLVDNNCIAIDHPATPFDDALPRLLIDMPQRLLLHEMKVSPLIRDWCRKMLASWLLELASLTRWSEQFQD